MRPVCCLYRSIARGYFEVDVLGNQDETLGLCGQALLNDDGTYQGL